MPAVIEMPMPKLSTQTLGDLLLQRLKTVQDAGQIPLEGTGSVATLLADLKTRPDAAISLEMLLSVLKLAGIDQREVAIRATAVVVTLKPTFGSLLRRLRLDKKWSQEQLAKAAKVTKAAVNQYESDRRVPNFAIVVRLAVALGVDVSRFQEADFSTDRDDETE